MLEGADRNPHISHPPKHRPYLPPSPPDRDPMPKPVVCPTCSSKIPYGTIHEDILDGYPRLGSPHPGQRTITCACCGAFLRLVDGVAHRWFMRRGGWSGGEAWSTWPTANAGAGRAVWHVPARGALSWSAAGATATRPQAEAQQYLERLASGVLFPIIHYITKTQKVNIINQLEWE